MLIFDGIRDVVDGLINLPDWIRAPMSLKSGTKVFLNIVSYKHPLTNVPLCEMVASPINFEHWGALWKVRAIFIDRPGVVNQFLEVIAEENFNVSIQESSSIENRSRHMLEVIIHLAGAHSPDDADERISKLRRRLIAVCINDLVFNFDDSVILTISPMEGLLAAWNHFKEAAGRNDNPITETATIKKAFLKLPDAILARILQDCGFMTANGESQLRVLLASDTKERTLRCYFPSINEHMAYIRIGHRDRVGALAQITRILREHEFDIVESFTRVQKEGDRSHFEIVLSKKLGDHFGKSEEFFGQIESSLGVGCLKDLELTLDFPQSIASPDEGKEVKPQGQASLLAIPATRIDTSKIIHQQLANCSKRIKRIINRDQAYWDGRRIRVLKELQFEEHDPNVRPDVFISYDFQNELYTLELEKHLRKAKCRIMTGKEPGGKPRFREVLIDRIKACDGYFGVWTLKNKSSRKYSPWLLWELAVAQTCGIPFQLLISHDFPKELYEKIIPEMHVLVFDDKSFDKKAKTATKWLMDEINSQRQVAVRKQ